MMNVRRYKRETRRADPEPAGTPAQVGVVTHSESHTEMNVALTRESVARSAGQTGRFEELLRNSYKQAYNFAYRLTGNAADAEDLVQETYLRAFRFFHRYDEGLPFVNWLCRIMSNANIDTMRKKGRLKTTSIDQQNAMGAPIMELPDRNAMPDRALIEQSLDDGLQDGLNAIAPEFRTAVLLADVEGLEYEEIAQVMSTSIGTVRSRIHRGRKQLRRFLLVSRPELVRGDDEL